MNSDLFLLSVRTERPISPQSRRRSAKGERAPNYYSTQVVAAASPQNRPKNHRARRRYSTKAAFTLATRVRDCFPPSPPPPPRPPRPLPNSAMDPAPQAHPILSYVLSRLPTLAKTRPAGGDGGGGGDFDIEQPPVHTPSPRTPSTAGEFELVERMPGLRHPSVLRAMTRAVADVSAARSALQVLGPRPDHELVDSSRAIVAAADAEAGGSRRVPEGDLEACRAVVRLEETHDAYEALLQEAEGRLEAVYRSAMEGKDLEEPDGRDESAAAAAGDDAAVQEEVIAVLRQAEEGKPVESFRLVDRQLRHLPEAFGRIQGLRVLDVSRNQLEVRNLLSLHALDLLV